jgi:hypothetical protein
MPETFVEVLLHLSELRRVFPQAQRLLMGFFPEGLRDVLEFVSAQFCPAGQPGAQPLDRPQVPCEVGNYFARRVVIAFFQEFIIAFPDNDRIRFHLQHFIQHAPGPIRGKSRARLRWTT